MKDNLAADPAFKLIGDGSVVCQFVDLIQTYFPDKINYQLGRTIRNIRKKIHDNDLVATRADKDNGFVILI